MANKTYKPRPPAISVFLGSDDADKERRINELDRLAKAYKVSRSKLFQKIADGELEIVPSQSRPRAS